MTKKMYLKLIVFIFIFIIIGIISTIAWNNRVASIITIDINPSIELRLNKKNKVKEVKALNKDANKIINNLKGQELDEAINKLSENLLNKGFMEDMEANILLYSEGMIENKKIVEYLKNSFENKRIHTEIITIKDITKKDIEESKKYNISPARVAYIKQISKSNKNITIEKYKNKSIKELKETKETGSYCEEGYFLENNFCYKEISRRNTERGKICPGDYNEYNGICYHSKEMEEGKNYICDDGSTLENKKCIRYEVYDANGKCNKGTYTNRECVEKIYIGDAVEYCRLTPEEDLLYNGRCLARKPTINGGCLGNDVVIDGYCYDTSPTSGYKSDWVCPDGSFITNPDGSLMNEDKKCYSETRSEPAFYCNGKDILEGYFCRRKVEEPARKETVCPLGYTLIENRMCIDLNKTKDKIDGDVCTGNNTRLKSNECIVYEIIEAKHY